MTCSSRDTSRRIKDLVSPQYVRFKRQRPRCLQWRGTGRRRWAGQSVNYTNQLAHAKDIFGQWKPSDCRQFGLSMLPNGNRNGRKIGMEYQTVILWSRTDFATT